MKVESIGNIDFSVERSEDCILIDTKAWEKNSAQKLEVHRLSGRTLPTYITRALNVNARKGALKGQVNEGDLILLSRVASDVSQYKAFEIEEGDKRYFNVPILQAIGTFQDDEISLEALKLNHNKIIVEKVEPSYGTYILYPNDNTFVGKVVKTSLYCYTDKLEKHRVDVGDTILIRDNIETAIFLDGKFYYALDEQMVVGIFHSEPYSIDDMEIINNTIIMSEYIPSRALNSKLLTPNLAYEDLDYSEISNRNLFQIRGVDSRLTSLKKDDILLVLRDLTNYVYFSAEKFFVISGMSFVSAKIEGE